MCSGAIVLNAMRMTLAQTPSQREDTTEHCFLMPFLNSSLYRLLTVQSKLTLATVVLSKVQSAAVQTAAFHTGYSENLELVSSLCLKERTGKCLSLQLF